MAKAGRQIRVAVRVLSALALLLLSFAHQPVLARQISPAMTAELMLPDGSIGDICFGLDGIDAKGHSSPHGIQQPVCDFCRLTAVMVLPSSPDQGFLVIRITSLAPAGQDLQAIFVSRSLVLQQSRAPPASL
jgi:hypothetical protein